MIHKQRNSGHCEQIEPEQFMKASPTNEDSITQIMKLPRTNESFQQIEQEQRLIIQGHANLGGLSTISQQKQTLIVGAVSQSRNMVRFDRNETKANEIYH